MEELINRLLAADQALRPFHAQVDAHWKESFDFSKIQQLAELSAQAREKAGHDPTLQVYAVLDEVADLFWSGQGALLWGYFAVCPAVLRAHLDYVGHAALQLTATGQRLWLQRALAMCVLGRGGKDYRDFQVTLSDLRQRCGALGTADFERAAELAGDQPGSGGMPGKLADFFRS